MTLAQRQRDLEKRGRRVKRRWCPMCREWGIKPGEDRCECGALPSPQFPVFVDVNAEAGDQ